MVDRFYLSSDNQLDSGDSLIGEFEITANMIVGDFYERNVPFFTPTNIGSYYLIGVTDATNIINEGGEVGDGNNTLVTEINIAPAYRAIASTDTEIGIAGQAVPLKGQALSNIDDSPVIFEFVTIAIENNGTIRELTAFTDGNGNFSKTFEPLPGEAGNYEIKAYFPGNSAEDSAFKDSFKLLGMQFSSEGVTHKVIGNQAFTAEVDLKNISDLEIQGITYTIEDAPSNWNIQVNVPENLAGSGENTISYTINIPNDSQVTEDTFNLKLISSAGVTAILPVTVDLERNVPRLVAVETLHATSLQNYLTSLQAGMLRGDQTSVEFEVKNEGGEVAENIKVLLPEAAWLKLASPVTIGNLEPGESAKVSLLLTPAADLPLNEYTGNLFLDAKGNNADLELPFYFRAVSDAVGSLRVNVTDELTFFAEGSPMLANATVILRDYFSGEELRRVVTDDTGMVSWDNLNEGYYKLEVNAENHSSFEQTIQLDAGEIETVNSFLSRQTVTYTWTVVPTEIEDKYTIKIESVFETDVPIPTVVIDPPLIDLESLQEVGQVMQVNMTLTNHGLIAANDLNLNFGEHPFYTIEPLIENIGTLAAKSSITVPVKVTRIADFEEPSAKVAQANSLSASSVSNTQQVPCNFPFSGFDYSYLCAGVTIKRGIPIPIINVEGNCPPPVDPGNGDGRLPPIPPPYKEDGGDGEIFIKEVDIPIIKTEFNCNPCITQIAENLSRFIVTKIPYAGIGIGFKTYLLIADLRNPDNEPPNVLAKEVLKEASKVYGKVLQERGYKYLGLAAKQLPNALTLTNNLDKACFIPFLNSILSKSPQPSSMELQTLSLTSSNELDSLEIFNQYIDELQSVIDSQVIWLGDDIWFQDENGEEKFSNFLGSFLERIQKSSDQGLKISSNERNQLLNTPVPEGVTGTDVNKFLDRWNRTVDYWNAGIFNLTDVPSGQSTDFLALDSLATIVIPI